MLRRFRTVVLLIAVSAVPVVAQQTAGAAEEKTSQTPHTMRLDGRDVKYTATAGTLPIRSDDGKVAARMFYVAYTKDGEDVKTRPVSFLYNGGRAPRRSGCTWDRCAAPRADGGRGFPARALTSSSTTRTPCSM
jgi:hypothetical protein